MLYKWEHTDIINIILSIIQTLTSHKHNGHKCIYQQSTVTSGMMFSFAMIWLNIPSSYND